MLTVQRPIRVKVVLTESSRARLIAEYQQQARQIALELEQWQFESRKLLLDAQKKSADTFRLAKERVAREEQTRKEKLELIRFKLDQLEQLPDGSELDYATVEGSVQIKVGDSWDEMMRGTEIIIRDGIVSEIREGGKAVE
ncbi:YlqD family protein [Brevibacillus fulvus]|uniref:YlqD protein n=1 Tax=Brevibacillus fulvus TaxID=1125967 RepID=A0A939BNQ9_9BACL|nr:YlqD family protein [Brevibacillus fulvus]MBM7589485.1 hypothetical protein [Brevibacillus fulvus]